MSKNAVGELLELRGLGDDWDGEGAIRPTPAIIDSAIHLLNRSPSFAAASRVIPLKDGRIAIEWYEAGNFWNLRVDGPGRGRLMTVKSDGTEFLNVTWSER